MILIDEPRPVALEDYDRCISGMVEALTGLPGVKAIYQVGGVSSPGISDIDMVVIFDDGIALDRDPRLDQSELARYLFTHQLFGTSQSLFEESRRYTFFHNFRLLYGEDLHTVGSTALSEKCKTMQRQWAREFLVRMLVNMTIEREYGIYKLRSLLLQGKALRYDLEFLGMDPPRLSGCLSQIVKWRSEWFENRPADEAIARLVNELWDALVAFLSDYLRSEPFFLPNTTGYHIGKNIDLRAAARVNGTSRGPKLKWAPTRFARTLISLQHRLNRFVVEVPIRTDNVPSRITESFEYSARAREYNRRYLTHLMPLTSSLVLTS